MQLQESLLSSLSDIEHILGYTFVNKNLLELAFVHRSYVNEHKESIQCHNERLEFLGDSVLGLIVADYLYQQFPLESEGYLSHARSHLVEAGSCVAYLESLGLSAYLLLGKGERRNDGKGRSSIVADLFEALIGAIYLDGGFESARTFFLEKCASQFSSFLEAPSTNWKAQLQDYAQKKHQKPPEYKIVKEEGPDHSKIFHVIALIDTQEMGMGIGSSKKQAEQAAAAEALRTLQMI